MKKNKKNIYDEFNKYGLQLFGLPEDEAVKILDELDRDHYLRRDERAEVAKLAQLKRIADTLEDMNSALAGMKESLEELEKCVVYPPAGYGGPFLRIAGSVET